MNLQNDWEIVGWSWICSCGAGTPGILNDYDVSYDAAKGHADKNPSHRTMLSREQQRWVIPHAVAKASRKEAEVKPDV